MVLAMASKFFLRVDWFTIDQANVAVFADFLESAFEGSLRGGGRRILFYVTAIALRTVAER